MCINEKNHELKVSIVNSNDDLDRIVNDINQASWDDANELTAFDVPSLSAYLKRQDTLFVTCYETSSTDSTLSGFASSRFELKPYDQEKWLYIDELDVCADQRRKGAGNAIMLTLLELAKSNDCEEVWLGTEVDNIPANALYRSLVPDEVEQFIGYTYEVNE